MIERRNRRKTWSAQNAKKDAENHTLKGFEKAVFENFRIRSFLKNI